MSKVVQLYLTVLICLCFSIQLSEQVPHASYETHLQDNYIVDGYNITLVCEFSGNKPEVFWNVVSQGIYNLVYYFYDGVSTIVEGSYQNRILQHSHTDTEIRMTFQVQKTLDDGTTWACGVRTFTSTLSDDIQLEDIAVPPTGSWITLIDSVIIDGTESYIQCTANSVYVGKAVTLFKLRIGSFYFSSGTKSETVGSISGTYIVTYTQPVKLTYNQHQGESVQCEVTWMSGIVVGLSAEYNLDIYYKATLPVLQLSPKSLAHNTALTLICTTFSNLSPRLRLYRQREGESVSVLHSVTDVTLTHTLTLEAADNKAEFYCRVDDNKNIPGWEFDVQSDKQQLTVWYSPSIVFQLNSAPQILEGDERELECTSTTGNPEPILTLYRGDMVVKATTGLELRHTENITRHVNKVNFQCIATSSLPEEYSYTIASESRYYSVIFPPLSNTLHSEARRSVLEGKSLTLTCTTGSSNPVSEMVWSKGSLDVMSGVTSQITDGEYGGTVLQSSYVLQVQREDNGEEVTCTPKWNGNAIIENKQKLQLNVAYPPTVTVHGPLSPILEGTDFNIICKIDFGNPAKLTSVYWEFVPKYAGSFTQPLPEQDIVTVFRVDKASFQDGGTYMCTVENEVGSQTGELQLVVFYQPQLLQDDSLVFFSQLGESVNLIIRVRALPELLDIDKAFLWDDHGRSLKFSINSTRLNLEEFQSILHIDIVTPDYYGQFTVTVDNGVGQPASFLVQLKQRGPPEKPQNCSLTDIGATYVTVTWVAGLNGGFTKSFKIIISEQGSLENTVFYTPYTDASVGDSLNYTISGLKASTVYHITVIATNSFNGGTESFSEDLVFMTKDVLKVNGQPTLTIDGSYANFEWGEIHGNYTKAEILKCMKMTACVSLQDITSMGSGANYFILRKDEIAWYDCVLSVEQNGEVVINKPFQKVESEPVEQACPKEGTSGAVIGCALVAVLAVIVASIFAVLFWRKQNKCCSNEKVPKDKREDIEEKQYVNVAALDQTSNYEMTFKDSTTAPAMYAQLQPSTLYEDLQG